MLEKHPGYNIFWITKNKSIFKRIASENKPVVMANSVKGIMACLRAGVAITSHGSSDFNIYCLNGIKQICLWHGMPLKKILYDADRYIARNTLKKLFFRFLLPYYNYSFPVMTITASDYFIPFLQSAFGLDDKHILKTGLPRCDKLFSEKKETFIVNLRNKFQNCTIALYMPTFRTVAYDGNVFDPFAGFAFDAQGFYNLLEKKNIVFLYKPHFCDEAINVVTSNRFFMISDDDFDDLYLFVKDIDVLITDYSSIYFDFLVLNKPIILAPFDYDFYIKNARSHYFNYSDGMQGIKAYSWKDLYKILDAETYYSVSRETIDKYCKYNDGSACKKCFENVIGLV
jgi:CDP-glycerol glycerophosphotransferase